MIDFEKSKKYTYAYIRTLSSVTIGERPENFKPDDTLIEARFFDEKGEYRIFHTDKGLETAEIFYKEYIDRSYDTIGGKFGKTITVRYIIDSDEDGQAYVRNTCLLAWSKGGSDVKE